MNNLLNAYRTFRVNLIDKLNHFDSHTDPQPQESWARTSLISLLHGSFFSKDSFRESLQSAQ